MDAGSLLSDIPWPSMRGHTGLPGAPSGALALAMNSMKLQLKLKLSYHTMPEEKEKRVHEK